MEKWRELSLPERGFFFTLLLRANSKTGKLLDKNGVPLTITDLLNDFDLSYRHVRRMCKILREKQLISYDKNGITVKSYLHLKRLLKTKEHNMLYFIQLGKNGPIKIGVTNNIDRRVAQIKTSTTEDVNIIAVIPESYELEKKLHSTFSKYHIRGEWFKPEKELIEYIKKISLVMNW